MFLIRSIAQVVPGRRDESVGLAKEFVADMVKEFGASNGRVLTASIGPSDSTLVMEMEHKTLAEFESAMEKANSWSKMSKYGPKLAELTVPGSHRFEVYRIY
jgi:copper oxidase (laccase) domain-containing protein